MTSKERVLCSLDWREPDRVPLQIYTTPEVDTKLKEHFDEVFRPRLQKFIDLAHEFGAKAMLHSCGDTHEIMPTFIDMDLDIHDAMQPEPLGMDPETIRALCKGKMAFCGLISTQHTLPHCTIDECRARGPSPPRRDRQRRRLHLLPRPLHPARHSPR